MMRNIFLIFIFLLTSCGYQPLYVKENSNPVTFSEIELVGDKDINKQILSAASIKTDEKSFLHKKLTIKNDKKIIETSKDSKGQPSSYRMILNLEMTIKDKNDNLIQKSFVQQFEYKNMTNKFELSEYESDIENGLIDRIIEQVIIYINI